MPVNLYDSPAQAQFINTYVPIQFEGLYRIADKAQKDLDEATAMEDEAISNYSTLSTPIAADRKTWNDKIYAPLRDLINSKITDSESLKDPIVQGELKAAIRRLKSNPLASSLINSAQNAKEFIKKSDPRWGGYEINKVNSWDTEKNGDIFNEQNTPYQTWAEISKPGFDNLKESEYGRSKDGFEKYIGITKDAIKKTADQYADAVATDPYVIERAKADLSRDPNAGTYIKLDSNKNPYIDYKAYISDKMSEANQDRISSKSEMNTLAWDRYKFGVETSLKRAEIASRESKTPTLSYVQTIRDIALNQAIQNKSRLILSKLDKLGSEGIAFKSAQDNISAIDSKLNSLKPGDSNIALLQKKKENIISTMPALQSNLEKRFQLERQKALSGKSSALTASEVFNISRIQIEPGFIPDWYDKKFGQKPTDVIFGHNEKKTVYLPQGTKDFSVIDPSNGAPILGTNRFSPGRRIVANIITDALKGNQLAGKVMYLPTANGTLVAENNEMHNDGYVYVSKSDLLNADKRLVGRMELLTKYGIVKEKKMIKREQEVTSTAVKPAIETTYYEIPVSSKITNNPADFDITSARVDAETPIKY